MMSESVENLKEGLNKYKYLRSSANLLIKQLINRIFSDPVLIAVIAGLITLGLVIICFLCLPIAWISQGDAATDEDAMREAYLTIIRTIKINYTNPYQSYQERAQKTLEDEIEAKYPISENDLSSADVSVKETNFYDISAEDAIATYYMARSAVLHEYHEQETDGIDLGGTFGPYNEQFKFDVSADQIRKVFTGNVTISDLDDTKLLKISDDHHYSYINKNVPYQENGIEKVHDVETETTGAKWIGEAHVYITANFSEGFMDDEYDRAIDLIVRTDGISHEEARVQLDNEIFEMQQFIAEEAKLGGYYNVAIASAGMDMLFEGKKLVLDGQSGVLNWYIIADEMDANGIYRFGQPQGAVSNLQSMQCTDFARWRFFKYYGWSYEGCNGDGGTVAACIVSRYPNAFELTTDINKVKPGSVYSIVQAGSGHVGFVEGFDGDDVVISDGNYQSAPYYNSIVLNNRYKLDSWYRNSHSFGAVYQYAVPKEGFLEQMKQLSEETVIKE